MLPSKTSKNFAKFAVSTETLKKSSNFDKKRAPADVELCAVERKMSYNVLASGQMADIVKSFFHCGRNV